MKLLRYILVALLIGIFQGCNTTPESSKTIIPYDGQTEITIPPSCPNGSTPYPGGGLKYSGKKGGFIKINKDGEEYQIGPLTEDATIHVTFVRCHNGGEVH
jgi:hypothetical protein